jgi:tetratricopeptide (TPR) repeat protein
MKKLLFLLLTISPLQAQENQNTSSKSEEIIPSLQEFMKLPEEQRKAFNKHYTKATQLIQEKRIFEAMSSLDKADKIFNPLSFTLNLRATCYVEMRDFDKARAIYEKIQELDPKNIANRFNVAEMHYVSKEWQLAHDSFSKILSEESDKIQNMVPITEFKILICKTKLKLQDEALILSQKYSSKDDSPFYYYAKALTEYENSDTVKAEEWTQKALRIFQNQSLLFPWQVSLEEANYLAVPVK